MSEKESSPANPHDKISLLDLEQQVKQREQVLGNVVEQLKPWLLEFGTWIFGGLIAFTLIIVATLLTVGPSHPAVLASVAIFAVALPLDVSGLLSLKLIRDMNKVAIDDLMKQAFQDAAIPNVEVHYPASDTNDSPAKRRTDVGLRFAVRLATVSVVFTLLGMTAALWYMAWWVAAIFVVMVVISLVITMNVITRLMRPEPETAEQLKLHYRKQNPR